MGALGYTLWKAYDQVQHETLIYKPGASGVSGGVIVWFQTIFLEHINVQSYQVAFIELACIASKPVIHIINTWLVTYICKSFKHKPMGSIYFPSIITCIDRERFVSWDPTFFPTLDNVFIYLFICLFVLVDEGHYKRAIIGPPANII